MTSKAGQLVESTLTATRGIADSVVPTVLSGSILADTHKAEAIEFPDIAWGTIDINTAGQYLAAVLAGILDLPIYRNVAFEDPGALGITVDTPVLDDSLYIALKGNILPDVTDGGYGIDTAVERDILERERDAVMQELKLKKDAVAIEQFASGLSMPTGEFLHQSILADIAAQNKLEEINGKITTDSYNRHAEAKKNAYESGAKLVDRVVDEYTIRVKTAIAVYAAKVSAFSKKTAAGVAVAKAELGAYNAATDAYSSTMKALEGQYRALANAAEYGYRTSDEQLGAAVDEAKAKVEIYLAEAKADLEEESARLLALAAVAAGALTAINVHAQVSESSSYSNTNSRGRSVTYSESTHAQGNTTHREFLTDAPPMPTVEDAASLGYIPSAPPPATSLPLPT